MKKPRTKARTRMRTSPLTHALPAALRYASILLLIIVAGLALEYAAGLLPQEAVMRHYAQSAEQLEAEGIQPMILNGDRADSMLDNGSEIRILHYSAAMDTRAFPEAVLTNPAVLPEEDWRPMAYYEAAASGAEHNYHYMRYWQGFRAIVRTLLWLCDYSRMRRLLLWAFTLLCAACALRLYQRTQRTAVSLVFVLSVLVMNPIVISTSFHYICCYALAMLGVLTVPRHEKRPARFFFAMGALTQFFDFYTAPTLTLIYPLMTLLFVRAADVRPRDALWRALGCVTAWLCAYALMWLAKLCLTTWLTGLDALGQGFNSFNFRVGIVKAERVAEYYSVPGAFAACLKVLGGAQLAALGMAFAGLCAWALRRGVSLPMGGAALLLGCVPLLWIAVAAQPTAIHAYFQYRTLGGTVFAWLCAPLLGQAAKRDGRVLRA